MIEDKQRWNERYLDNPMPQEVSPLVEKYIEHAHVGQAIDIACGTGRNTHYLADLGFLVDAIDISDYALERVKNSSTINKIDADLDKYNLTPNKYDLIVNVNYLNRRLVSQMKDALKSGGVVMFETFIVAHGDFKMPTTNLDYLLRKNELLHSFIGLDVIYYEERIDTNLRGERIKVASIIAKKV
ncbi:MAG: methyltransferase domain-containing protein [Sulfurimonas sp.]|uniref:class I SAM-dependent methyltransferase n=1 Tax=Sulfurimonas sp. TaxID=2022749 RepID=UPI00261594D3|nr:class I SAM-dependent methyltransferase [Sulfurimonas sp.]MCW8894477.1 methyltransferase domain-containing protein [Sulfurimonas sp.]MCW8954094.1 methyltransferase domain-containing protein [Sulfurimonas sp.]MCW9068175.1 methyltransferase domain-containing protein [Sulfurimonas sp.]